MRDLERADAIRGTTMRWSWNEGPTQGKTYEHQFGEDGTVRWRGVEPGRDGPPPPESAKAGERAPYAAIHVSADVYLVSYLAPSGFTLTVALDFSSRGLSGFASSADEWYLVRGTFETVE